MVGGIEGVFHRIESILNRVSTTPGAGSSGFRSTLQAAISQDTNPQPLAATPIGDGAAAIAADSAEATTELEAVRTITPPPGVYLTIGGYVGTTPATSVGAVAPSGAAFPVVGVSGSQVTNSFGWPWGAHRHAGIDIFAAEGTPVVANVSGTIEIANGAPVGGNRIWIRGDDGRGYYYAHLSGFAVGIEPGLHVGAGQTIGYVGSTGDAAGKSPHLHFAVSRDNRKPGDSDDPAAAGWLDPGPFLGIAPAAAR